MGTVLLLPFYKTVAICNVHGPASRVTPYALRLTREEYIANLRLTNKKYSIRYA